MRPRSIILNTKISKGYNYKVMAGILNKKERIMDVIVTREGRRQMADGNLRATFASFTDNMAFYESDIVSGSTDPTDRLYFEAFSTEADQIIYEKDDSGRLVGEINNPDLTLLGDQLFKKNAPGEFLELTGSVFASEIDGIVTASIFNFKSQQIIGSEKGNQFNSKQFNLTRNKIYFNIDNYSPFQKSPDQSIIDLQATTPLFFDRRLANKPQFKWLPPVNTLGVQVANFENVKTFNAFSSKHLIREDSSWGKFLKDISIIDASQDIEGEEISDAYETQGGIIETAESIAQGSEIQDYLQKETIKFEQTSNRNRLFCQMFEVNAEGNNRKIIKLDILDMGVFNLSDKELLALKEINNNQSSHKSKHFFYAGKVFEDEFGVPSFLRLFTLMFD